MPIYVEGRWGSLPEKLSLLPPSAPVGCTTRYFKCILRRSDSQSFLLSTLLWETYRVHRHKYPVRRIHRGRREGQSFYCPPPRIWRKKKQGRVGIKGAYPAKMLLVFNIWHICWGKRKRNPTHKKYPTKTQTKVWIKRSSCVSLCESVSSYNVQNINKERMRNKI